MASVSVHPVLRFLRRVVAPGGDAPDAQLLTQFVTNRDEAAFAALIRRHGPMVLGVCCRVLGDTPDAEDAFQATFLVLVRRASSLGRPDLLGNWLYGVAYRTALKARADSARRRRHEDQVVPRTPTDTTAAVDERDLQAVLDEELNRLPAKYRVPLVLCHLQGQTHEEVARHLGCPRETVTTRLTRARERLRSRMLQRGLALSAGAAVMSEKSLLAALPAALAEHTIKAARFFAAGPAAAGVVSAKVAALSEGVVQTMVLTRITIAIVVLLAVGSLAGGAGLLAHRTQASESKQQVAEPMTQPTSEVALAPEEAPEAGEAVSVKSLPPVVVKTMPQSGDTQVDASNTKEIRATFSKDMMDQSWSWSQISNETFPKMTGKIRYDKDKRTCILPVKLEAGKTYVFWLNSAKFGNFKDAEGQSAVPYLLVFETK